MAKKTTTKTKPPNTLLSSQTTPLNSHPLTGNPATILRGIGTVNSLPLRSGSARVIMSELLYALDLRSETGQIFDEQRIAAVDVKDIVHFGVTVGDQPSQHQAGAGPDVR